MLIYLIHAQFGQCQCVRKLESLNNMDSSHC